MRFISMASELTEVDIPGASLQRQAPEALKITELKFWLRCHAASRSCKHLRQRMTTCKRLFAC